MMFFYIYCFLGWCVESAIVSFGQKRFVNRGYLTIPMLPIYGLGAVVVLFVSLPVRDSIILVYILGAIAATILEYITGWLMETTLKVKYWDYTGERGNIKGRICIKSSLFWGVLSIFMTYIIHEPIEKFVLSFSVLVLNSLVTVISALFLVDFILSTKKAIDFKHMLEYMERTREKIEELYTELEEKGRTLKESLEDKIEESIESQKEKYDATTEEIMKKIALLNQKREEAMEKMSGFNGILRANPTVTSKYFHRALKEIRERMKQK